MNDTARFESDPFLLLLTDALRLGPGSPQWHQAIEELRARNLHDSDEYRLICTVREHLASGRDFRSIRPGPGFTRKVMEAIDRQADRQGRRPSISAIIAVLGAVLALAALVAVVVKLVGGSGQGEIPPELSGVFASTIIAPRDLAGGVAPEWQTVGEPPVASRDRRGLVAAQVPRSNTPRVSGLVSASAIRSSQTFMVDAALAVGRAEEGPDVQVFVAEELERPGPQASGGGRELVAWVSNGQVKVVRDGAVVATGPKLAEKGNASIAIRVSQYHVMVEVDGRTVFRGPNGLSGDRPRYAGLRFLTRGQERTEAVSVQSLRILKP